MRAAVRNAKKAGRPTKIGMPEPKQQNPAKSKNSGKDRRGKAGRVTGLKGVFDNEMGGKRRAGMNEGDRANRTDRIGGMDKKGPKGKGKGKR